MITGLDLLMIAGAYILGTAMKQWAAELSN